MLEYHVLKMAVVAVLLFGLLSIVCRAQVPCSQLTVFSGNQQIPTDSICDKKWRTAQCAAFSSSFDRSQLPEGFPKTGDSVESPSDISLKGTDYLDQGYIYPGMKVAWKSPLSGAARRECYGYLLVWRFEGSSDIYCQLFLLKNVTEIKRNELVFQYQINTVQQNSDYTVTVYSMPSYGSEYQNNSRTFVRVGIKTPSAHKEIREPAKWNPYLTYTVLANGTVTVKFDLPPATFNLTRFGVYLSALEDPGNYVDMCDIRPGLRTDRNTEVTHSFIVKRSGVYKVVVWVEEEEGNRNVEGKCSCWVYITNDGMKGCENACGSMMTGYFKVDIKDSETTTETTNSTKPETTSETTSPTKHASESPYSPVTPNITKHEATVSPVTHIQPSDPSYVIIVSFVVTVALLVLAAVIFCCLRKNNKVKLKIRGCIFASEEKKKPHVIREDSEICDREKPPFIRQDTETYEQSDNELPLPAGTPLTTKTIYIMSANDHEAHLHLVKSFAEFLMVHCHCNVIVPVSCDVPASQAYQWFISNISKADRIIFVSSEAAENLILAYLKNRTYSSDRLSSEQDIFYYGFKHLLYNQEAREKQAILVLFRGNHCQKYLQTSDIYALPENMPHLLRRIHNLNASDAKAYENQLPMQTRSLEDLSEGIELLHAIKAASKYEEENAGWFEKRFGTLKLLSEDSACGSSLARSVSTQNMTCSPVSVFEQPDFPSALDSDTIYSSFGPQAMPFLKYAHTQRGDGDAGNYGVLDQPSMVEFGTVANLEEGLSCVTIPLSNYCEVNERNCVQQEDKEMFDGVSIVPPKSEAGVNFDSFCTALNDINKSSDNSSMPYSPQTIDHRDNIFQLFDDMQISRQAFQTKLIPPDTLSNIQVDSVSCALRGINDDTEHTYIVGGRCCTPNITEI